MATATLNTAKLFNIGSVGQDAIKWRLWKHATSTTTANKLGEGSLNNNPAALTQNQFYQVPANEIVLSLPSSTTLTDAAATDALKGIVGRVTYVELFSDAQSGAFKTNRVAIQANEWTYA